MVEEFLRLRLTFSTHLIGFCFGKCRSQTCVLSGNGATAINVPAFHSFQHSVLDDLGEELEGGPAEWTFSAATWLLLPALCR